MDWIFRFQCWTCLIR